MFCAKVVGFLETNNWQHNFLFGEDAKLISKSASITK